MVLYMEFSSAWQGFTKGNWTDLNLTYELNDTMPPSPELLEKAKAILEQKAGR